MIAKNDLVFIFINVFLIIYLQRYGYSENVIIEFYTKIIDFLLLHHFSHQNTLYQ